VLHFQQSEQGHQLQTEVNKKFRKLIETLESSKDSDQVPADLQHEAEQTINQLVNQQAAEVDKEKQIKEEIRVGTYRLA